MIESNEEKKKLFYTIVLILTLITMVIGATLAYFHLLSSQKEEGTILYTGKLEINYIDGTYIKNPELLPIKNPSYTTTKGVYKNTFSVISEGTLEQTISLGLKVSKNEFKENAMKYAVYNENGKQIAHGNIPQKGEVILASDMYLEPTGTAKYTLMVWLDNTNYNQNFEMGKTITAKINVYSRQMKY